MAGERFLGIDLGTTALKAVISDGLTRIHAEASAPVPSSRPQRLWSEQDPEDWWRALIKACKVLRTRHPAGWARIAGISFSGHMHGVVQLKASNVLRPCILHNDGRAFLEAKEINARYPALAALAGVRCMAGFAAPKLLWLKRHEPELMAAADRLLLPKDWLRFRMTGHFASDPVDASGAWLLDVGARRWSRELADAAQIPISLLPELREANDVAAGLAAPAAAALGLKAGLPIVTGTGDAAAAALGLGLVEDGDGVLSLGTAAQIFVTRDGHHPQPDDNIHAFAHAMPRRWFQMAALLNGASPLAWFADRFGGSNIPALLKAVEKRMAQPSRLLFLPYLSGERTPHDDPLARGAFYGLDAGMDRVDLARAVLEGVALSLADCHDILAKAGAAPRNLFAVGGGTRSRLWSAIIASALGRPLSLIREGAFGGSLGAARLARSGVTGEEAAFVFSKPALSAEVAPVPAWRAFYADRLAAFRQLYAQLRPVGEE